MTFRTTLHPLPGGRQLAEGILSDEASLNALSPQMADEMLHALATWRADDRIALVLLRGEGKHFCAGGNIRDITQKICDKKWDEVDAFFQAEYTLDATLYAYPKPVIAWGSGAVMGGGMGVLQGCALRLAADGAKIAMPEVHIGLFPDVGAAWFLRKCPHNLGLFLGLCGITLSPQDAHFANLADYVMPADGRENFIAKLQAAQWSGDRAQDLAQAQRIAEEDAKPATSADSELAEAMAEITRCCGEGDTATILRALSESSSSYITAAAKRAATASPGAVAFWHRHWEAMDGASRATVFAADYRGIMAFSRDPRSEFVEGVRALVIDKDKTPNWQHKSVDSVPADWPPMCEEDAAAAENLRQALEVMDCAKTGAQAPAS